MHIGVDGNLLCGKKTGMGTVVYAVIKRWKKEACEKITIFVPENIDEDLYDVLDRNGIIIKILGKTNYFVWEQIVIPKAVKKEKIDVLWCPYNTAPFITNCPIVVTVHDLIYMSLKVRFVPSLYKKAGAIYRKSVVPIAVKKAEKIITISNYAKKEICDYFPSSENKIEIVYNSADFNNNALSADAEISFFERNGISKPYILGFGSLETRKNTLGLIKAFDMLPENHKVNNQLVLFGFRGFEQSKEQRYIQDNHCNVVVLDYISDEEKASLYRNAKMFVFPSFSEGFGIPLLESFTNNCPVITSNRTALPEIGGSACIYIEPDDLKNISDAMLKLLESKDIRYKLILNGKQRLLDFDWDKTSEGVIKILRQVGMQND